MVDNMRVVRFYKNRFVSTTQGAVNQKEYTGRTEIQIKVHVNSVVGDKVVSSMEWQTVPTVDMEG